MGKSKTLHVSQADISAMEADFITLYEEQQALETPDHQEIDARLTELQAANRIVFCRAMLAMTHKPAQEMVRQMILRCMIKNLEIFKYGHGEV